MKRVFTLGQLLSAVGGNLLCSVDELYEVYNFLTQDTLFTHQLPRAFKECEPVLKDRYPDFAKLPFNEITTENWEAWLAKQVERFGPTVELEPIGSEKHVFIDPTREAEKMVGSERVIVVTTKQ